MENNPGGAKMTKIEKELEVFNRKYLKETLQICEGKFCFRYYENSNSKEDVTLVILVGGLFCIYTPITL